MRKARPVGAETADDAADLAERAAVGLAELGGDLLGDPPVLRPEARASRGSRSRPWSRVVPPVAVNDQARQPLPSSYVECYQRSLIRPELLGRLTVGMHLVARSLPLSL